MYLVDYHIHTKYSVDSKADPVQVCESAIKNGLAEIAVTDHADMLASRSYKEDIDEEAWYQTMRWLKAQYEGRLKIRIGIELGQPQSNPAEAKSFLDKFPMDFVLGSIHNLDDDLDIYYLDFTKADYHKVYLRYLSELKELALNYSFDVMSHITYPSRYIYQQLGVKVDTMAYWMQYEELFKILIAKGRGIELNMSGIARGLGETMPDLNLLKFYQECGGEIITIGSDAHVPEQVGTTAKQAIELLKKAGFDYLTVYEEHQPKFISIFE